MDKVSFLGALSMENVESNQFDIFGLRLDNDIGGGFDRSSFLRVLSVVIVVGLLGTSMASAVPVLELSPSSGREGDNITVNGHSFNVIGREFPEAKIWFNDIIIKSNVRFKGSGFTTWFIVPSNTPPGNYTVNASGPLDWAKATFKVEDVYAISEIAFPRIAKLAIAKPVLELSPTSGKKGDIITVNGRNFIVPALTISAPPPPTVEIKFNDIIVNTSILRGGGNFTTSFIVPFDTIPGNYMVQAIGPLQDSANATFKVADIAPHALIDANPSSGYAPLLVHFNGARSFDEDGSINSYKWDFGDGSEPAAEAELNHTYNLPGKYRATLTVIDDQGQSGTNYITVGVGRDIPPVAIASANTTSGSAPLNVDFDISQSYDPNGRIVMYHWDFGDSHSAEGDWSEEAARLNHVYQVLGNYTAVLTVTDNKGMTGKREVTITVLNKNPVANIVVSPREGSVPLNVKLDGSQSYDPDGTNLTYTWDFGDNTFGNGIIIEHTYEKAQTYQLSLIVTDPYGASGRAETTIEVKPAPLIPGIEPWWLVVDVFVIVAGVTVALCIKWPTSKDGQRKDTQSPPMLLKRKFLQLPVNIETHSGAEYSAGIDSEDTKLTGISVDIRSGIWKEGDKI